MNQKELENKIKEAQKEYYAGHPILSDAEFDKLWDDLKNLYPDSELLSEVGSDLEESEGFEKVELKSLMGSQNKANTAEEMEKFISENGSTYMETYKLDGSSAELYYENGKFIRGCSRGNGCFDYETLLETDKGKLPIGYIVENQIFCNVKAFDIDKQEEIWTPIKNHFINENNSQWYELETDDGKIIKVTGNHKVWIPNSKVWKKVEDLKIGEEFKISN